MVVEAISIVVAVVAILVALWLYAHLYRWADQCKHARIAIAYKGKVKLDAPLVEWLLWIRQADKDRDSNGRVVYSMGATRVAIIKAGKKRKPPRQRRPARVGRWTAKDETDHSKSSQLSRVTNGGGK